MKVGKSASWSKWWCVKNTEFISVGDIPAFISFQVVAGPQSKSKLVFEKLTSTPVPPLLDLRGRGAEAVPSIIIFMINILTDNNYLIINIEIIRDDLVFYYST